MQALAEALPAEANVTYMPTTDALKPALIKALQPGDVVMVKSSKGIGFAKLVDTLVKTFPAETAATQI